MTYSERIERLTIGRMQNPIRGFLHGGAALASLVGLGVLAVETWGRSAAFTGALVFGAALVIMYTVSALYHSIPWDPRWKTRLQRLDHSIIYVVVAATFTPFAIAALEGTRLAVALAMVWGVAVVGIALKALLPSVKTWLSVTLQMVMGWMAVVWTPDIVERLGWGAVALIALGGLSYTAGVVVFTTERPRLAPRTFSYHELFHVLVVVGSGIHFLAIASYALPAIS